LFAPQAVWDCVCDFLEQEPSSFEFTPVWTESEIVIGDLGVEFVEMDHSVPTVGSRWDGNGRTLFFTGDTGPAGDWRRLAADVDVMLAEASYQGETEDKLYPHHLTAAEAGQIARQVGAGKLVLTHIPPYLDPSVSVGEAEQVFDRPVRLAVAGASFDV